MRKEDHPWLKEELDRRIERFKGETQVREEAFKRLRDQRKTTLMEYGFASRTKPFSLSTADFVGQAVPPAAAVNQ